MLTEKNSKKGFTLIEVIVVLVILAILAAILIPSYIKYIDKANRTECTMIRSSLSKQFTAMVDYDKNLRKCTTDLQIFNITGSNVPKYMLDNGYYDGKINCPVDGESYTTKITFKNGVAHATFLCGCVDTFMSYQALCKEKLQEVLNKNKWAGRDSLIKAVYEENGSLEKIASDVLADTQLEGTVQYWRPYYLSSDTIVYYGNETDYDKSVTANWEATVLSVGGKTYISNGKKSSNLAWFKDYSDESSLVNSTKFKSLFIEK